MNPRIATPPTPIIDQGEGSNTDDKLVRLGQPRDKVGVDRGSGCRVVFANRPCTGRNSSGECHEEAIARRSESIWVRQAPDEVEVDCLSRRGVEFSDPTAGVVGITVRYEEVVSKNSQTG